MHAATTADALDQTLMAPFYKHAPIPPADIYGSHETLGNQKSLIDWKEITGGSLAVENTASKNRLAINYFLQENKREESLENQRKLRALQMHTL